MAAVKPGDLATVEEAAEITQDELVAEIQRLRAEVAEVRRAQFSPTPPTMMSPRTPAEILALVRERGSVADGSDTIDPAEAYGMVRAYRVNQVVEVKNDEFLSNIRKDGALGFEEPCLGVIERFLFRHRRTQMPFYMIHMKPGIGRVAFAEADLEVFSG